MAVSGGDINVFECLLQYGVHLDEVNSRKHSIEDLTTDERILTLIEQYQLVKEDPHAKIPFEEEELKFLCGICKRFFKQGSVKTHWLFEQETSLDKEMLETRCFDC